ncbi:MAG: LysR family transcriptional regulator [Planctomycetes bacterium]|nr:LysR family transcriptional regulator [Planctomycetota bacterium]
MDIRVLRYFVTVAREGSITNAAKFLHVTQPTLSRQLKELEEELGKRLFIRSTAKMKLTEEGMLLRKRAEDILDMVDKTRDEFRTMDDITGGDIHIGGAESHAITHIAQAAINLQQRYANVRYHLYSGNAGDVTERLDRGLLDFCLLVMPVDLSKYNFIILPERETWGVLMRKDSPLVVKKTIRAKDLQDLPLICSRQALNNELGDWFGDRRDSMRIAATYNLIYNGSIMVEEGMGYLIGFDGLVNTGSESSLTFRPLAPKLESGLCIAWKKYQVFTRAEELFLEEIKARFGIHEEE